MSEAAFDQRGNGLPQLEQVEVIDHVWIEMSDGVRLSAKLWLPESAKTSPVPAILEFIPYRKDDAVAIRDHRNHAWFAARGYACVRPDMRGHGDSEGIMLDEYLPREQQDAVEVIEWISRQTWCSGNVGMMGISWGGIASLQAAVHQPPALKAIIPVGASVDRYYDDGAYLVGGYPGQGLGWGGVMFGYCIRPPDPAVVGAGWREMWMARLEQTPMFAEKWLRHQLRNETWVQGSVCEQYDKIEVPVLGVSGWNDCWPNTMIRLLENIKAPCRVVSGPWAHVYPNQGGPGPLADFLQLALDWWDHWLKGLKGDVMNAPAFLAYIQDSHLPDRNPTDRPGRWVGENEWPSQSIANKSFGLAQNALVAPGTQPGGAISFCSALSLGLATGEYMPMSGVEELPDDQCADDAQSVCFDTAPLAEPIEVLGTPRAHLKIASDCPHGLVAARLCDVAPNGTSTLMTYGVLNLKMRAGREQITPIIAGEMMDVTVRLNDIGWRVKPGHRIRLALSSQLWPMAWPVCEQATLSLDLAACRLDLPERRPVAGSDMHDAVGRPDAADPPPHKIVRPPSGSRQITHDSASGETRYDVAHDGGEIQFEASGLTFGSSNSQCYAITDDDPLSAQVAYRADFSFARDAWQVTTESELVVTCTASHFVLEGRIAAFEGDAEAFARNWDVKIPREVY